MKYRVLSEFLQGEIATEDNHEELSDVDEQATKIVKLFSTHLDRILDPFL